MAYERFDTQEIDLENGKLLVVRKGNLKKLGAVPSPKLCGDGSPLRQLVGGVYQDGTTVSCPTIEIEGETFEVLVASVGFCFHVEP